ncbi:sugar porter family MFS transporter [Saccharibacter sp. 17.LH.SD]|uniref:sugar porter family MFS transporter n=1 Tax=Saccharibacter sp. 17.LH.SD TaxID=2689393 RepID=UPI00136D2927|nr:sugar porter family MFS transporter [Saccharibacter sp. 17.LH.SD]MXV43753.1 sugar porter family MFS transporter [Saccharibacter sp. 17.LH.SD]
MKTTSQEPNVPESGEVSKVNVAARRRVLTVCIIAALSGLICGLDIGVVSGVLKPFGIEFHASTITLEWIVGGMLIGAIIGAFTGGTLCQFVGRKYALIVSAAMFAIGAFGCASSSSIIEMFIFRVICGLGMGFSAFSAPAYLSEIASKESRGAMGSTYQLMLTIGIFLAFFSNSWLAPSGSWRSMLLVEAIPAACLAVVFFFLPHSPRDLLMRGLRDEAFKGLSLLRDNPESVHEELDSIAENLQVKQDGWHLFKVNSNFRRSVALGMLLQLMQQFAGINIVMYYAPRILEVAKFSPSGQMWGTAVIGLVNVLMTFVAVGYSDRWGRKPILYTGYAIMAASMASLAMILAHGPNSTVLQMSALAAVIFFVGGFSMSAGPLAWVICAEIQPTAGRNLGLSLSTGTNMFCNLLIGTTFLSMLEFFGSANTFWIFAAFNVFAIVMIYLFVPETKGVTLETIEKRLMSGVKLRNLGR